MNLTILQGEPINQQIGLKINIKFFKNKHKLRDALLFFSKMQLTYTKNLFIVLIRKKN